VNSQNSEVPIPQDHIGPCHDMPASAEVVIPANGLLVFAREREDR